jgi:hypothetical protein
MTPCNLSMFITICIPVLSNFNTSTFYFSSSFASCTVRGFRKVGLPMYL